ncbi:PAS and ANTAR domain-containing protein [Nocardia sp. NPDC057030]|uniref:PAS and ANTAR domain-containing protein n=1 Tax=unclassified Nocardia TaxID=2637762 RepID=UPI00362672FE
MNGDSGSGYRGNLGDVERVVGAGTPLGTGGFRFWFAEQLWEWSDEVARMYGYRAGEVVPTTELLLAHKHPADRDRVEEAIVTSVEDDAPFSCSHRIIDFRGVVRDVIVVSDPMRDEQGAIVGTAGFYIDITDADRAHQDQGVGSHDAGTPGGSHDVSVDSGRKVFFEEILPEVLLARVAIEQVKGVLMVVYGISAEQAFRVLRWRSQETNVKLRVLAERVLAGLAEIPAAGPSTRSRIDHLLLTAHDEPVILPSS